MKREHGSWFILLTDGWLECGSLKDAIWYKALVSAPISMKEFV